MAKTRQKLKKPAPEACQALGSFEAAAVMGVHFSTPGRMAAKGMIACREVPMSGGIKSAAIYDGRSCEEDYLDYEEKLAAGGSGKRPRGHLHQRPEALKRLRAVETPIAFADAITTAEAAEILSVHNSFITRMIAAGDIIGRRLWSPRGSAERIYIVSRQSCVENAQEMRKIQATGKKNGRPRRFS